MAKKRFIYVCILLFGLSTGAWAENQWDHITMRNELRIGWGDQLFESLMWHNPTSHISTLPAGFQYTQSENYTHNQHLWVEYQWRFYHWLSFGAMVDLSEVGWDNVTRNGAGVELNRSDRRYFYNMVFMPTLRFTYYHHPYVNLYSGMGLGFDINGGTETNSKGQYTDIGAAINITFIGVSANYNRWFMALDFGSMSALRDINTIFMASSRIINFSLGARF